MDIVFPLILSLKVALFATALVAVVGLPAAYLLATREFRGKSLVDVAVTLPLVLPPIVTGYCLLLLLGRNGPVAHTTQAVFGRAVGITFTWEAAALASFAVAVPFTVRTARAAIENVDKSLIAASYTLGRSESATAFLVVLPLAARGIAAGLVLSFARALGEFGATIMVAGNIPGRTNTMPLEIYTAAVSGNTATAAVLTIVFAIVSIVILLAANRLTKAVKW